MWRIKRHAGRAVATRSSERAPANGDRKLIPVGLRILVAAILHPIIELESACDPTAVCPAGAAGLMRLMPAITGLQPFSGKIMAFIIAVDGIITTIVGAIVFSYKRMEVQIRQNLHVLAEKDREAAQMQ